MSKEPKAEPSEIRRVLGETIAKWAISPERLAKMKELTIKDLDQLIDPISVYVEQQQDTV